jgi:hypothetical protein
MGMSYFVFTLIIADELLMGEIDETMNKERDKPKGKTILFQTSRIF